jgi:hypothetical protein
MYLFILSGISMNAVPSAGLDVLCGPEQSRQARDFVPRLISSKRQSKTSVLSYCVTSCFATTTGPTPSKILPAFDASLKSDNATQEVKLILDAMRMV